jgi:circadian clock protein KaiB
MEEQKSNLREGENAAMEGEPVKFVLQLFVAGMSPKSTLAITTVRSVCEAHLPGRYALEVIDIYLQPDLARQANIIAAPTLIKILPLPPRRLVGDLSNPDRILRGLDR